MNHPFFNLGWVFILLVSVIQKAFPICSVPHYQYFLLLKNFSYLQSIFSKHFFFGVKQILHFPPSFSLISITLFKEFPHTLLLRRAFLIMLYKCGKTSSIVLQNKLKAVSKRDKREYNIYKANQAISDVNCYQNHLNILYARICSRQLIVLSFYCSYFTLSTLSCCTATQLATFPPLLLSKEFPPGTPLNYPACYQGSSHDK